MGDNKFFPLIHQIHQFILNPRSEFTVSDCRFRGVAVILLMGNSRFYGGVVIVEVGDGGRLFFEDGCTHFI